MDWNLALKMPHQNMILEQTKDNPNFLYPLLHKRDSLLSVWIQPYFYQFFIPIALYPSQPYTFLCYFEKYLLSFSDFGIWFRLDWLECLWESLLLCSRPLEIILLWLCLVLVLELWLSVFQEWSCFLPKSSLRVQILTLLPFFDFRIATLELALAFLDLWHLMFHHLPIFGLCFLIELGFLAFLL